MNTQGLSGSTIHDQLIEHIHPPTGTLSVYLTDLDTIVNLLVEIRDVLNNRLS